MRTTLAITLALSLLAGGAAAAPVMNQLENGSFDDFEDDDPVDWRILAGNANPTDDAVDGQAVVLNIPGNALSAGVAQTVEAEDGDAPIVPNAEYDLAFQGNLETSTANTPVSAQARIVWQNALGQEVGTDTIPVSQSDEYVSYDETFRAPPDATQADVQFELDRPSLTDPTNANLKVDDAAFGPTSP
jgi:hypothetical protein